MSTPADHPSSFLLEAWHVGEGDTAIGTHLAACEQCRRYVAGLEDARQQFLQRGDPADFVRAARAHADAAAPPRRLRWLPLLAAPVAGALLLVVVVNRPPSGPGRQDRGAGNDQLRAKGALAVTVVRDRGGAQSRHAGALAVRPGDRLRFEVTVPAPGRLAAGLRSTDGAWLSLLEPADVAAGTAVLPALAVDDKPSSGRLFVGAPQAVALAHAGRDPAAQVAAGAMATVELTWEPVSR